MDRTIDVLIVEPGKNPCPSTIADNLETLQQIVGGPIEAGSYLPQRVMLICNGEGKNMGLPPNRPNPADSTDTICGTFLLCSFEGEHFASLTPAQQTQFQAYFALPSEPVQGGKEASRHRTSQIDSSKDRPL